MNNCTTSATLIINDRRIYVILNTVLRLFVNTSTSANRKAEIWKRYQYALEICRNIKSDHFDLEVSD